MFLFRSRRKTRERFSFRSFLFSSGVEIVIIEVSAFFVSILVRICKAWKGSSWNSAFGSETRFTVFCLCHIWCTYFSNVHIILSKGIIRIEISIIINSWLLYLCRYFLFILLKSGLFGFWIFFFFILFIITPPDRWIIHAPSYLCRLALERIRETSHDARRCYRWEFFLVWIGVFTSSSLYFGSLLLSILIF